MIELTAAQAEFAAINALATIVGESEPIKWIWQDLSPDQKKKVIDKIAADLIESMNLVFPAK